MKKEKYQNKENKIDLNLLCKEVKIKSKNDKKEKTVNNILNSSGGLKKIKKRVQKLQNYDGFN